MAKVALITDTHWGVRDDNQIIAAHQAKFYREVFFPYIDEHDIKYVRHLGDIVDRRKYINYVTARNMRMNFIDPCRDRDLDVGVIVGNHDTFYKNTNEVNSMDVLFRGHSYDKFKWYQDPTEEVLDGTKIVMMPWICADNFSDAMAMINNTDAQCLFGHLEVAGFESTRVRQLNMATLLTSSRVLKLSVLVTSITNQLVVTSIISVLHMR